MSDELVLKSDHLYFVPLGGSEQFGVNFNLYHYQDKWLAIDCGIGFADQRYPGIDILLPDASFIEDHTEDLEGLIITHAHEDHIGAVPHLWPRLGCPIYCTEFTAAVLRKKFREFPECRDADIITIAPGDKIDIGPYKVEFIHVTHSIPQTCSVIIHSQHGKVVHSGDWNLDPSPVIDVPTDEESFKRLGAEGVLAYIGDSTNSNVDGFSGSEKEVEKGLAKLFAECDGRVAVTIFASNIGRIQSICKAAKKTDRNVAVVGRSLHTMIGAAIDCGYLKDIPDLIKEDEIGFLPDDKQVIIVTGSQGESRAALARIARGENRDISLGRGDAVVFSARAIPGNEKDINTVINNLVGAGVQVITPDDTEHLIHVSGHPRRGEIAQMLQWVKPTTVIPVHGERMQLEAQAELAAKCQIDNVIVPNNGSVISLAPGAPEIIDHVETGLLAIEPRRVMDANHPAIAQRRKFQYTGALFVTVTLSQNGHLVQDPQVSTLGLIDDEDESEFEIYDDLKDEIQDILKDMHKDDLYDDHAVHEELRIGARRFVNMVLGMKPITQVHIIRV